MSIRALASSPIVHADSLVLVSLFQDWPFLASGYSCTVSHRLHISSGLSSRQVLPRTPWSARTLSSFDFNLRKELRAVNISSHSWRWLADVCATTAPRTCVSFARCRPQMTFFRRLKYPMMIDGETTVSCGSTLCSMCSLPFSCIGLLECQRSQEARSS